MKGWRVVLFNAVVMFLTMFANWSLSVDWVSMVGPVWAIGIMACANMILRAFTTTPIFEKEKPQLTFTRR